MNNEYFRRLLSNNSGASNSKQDAANNTGSASQGTAAQSRKSVFGSMTPRAVRRNGSNTNDYGFSSTATDQDRPRQKKPKSSVPRGVKLADGYRDRALERLNAEKEGQKEDEKFLKLKDLAEQVKSGKLSVTEFERLSQEVAGGDVASTHLVRGLDRKLLERVRRGEDVAPEDQKPVEEAEDDVDDEFDELQTKEVQRVEKQDKDKAGNVAKASAPIAGRKRTRDDIIRELKAKRQAEAEANLAARPELGDKFKSIDRKPEVKTTIDSKGREVIYTRDENGKLKKKVRKVAAAPEPVRAEPDLTTSKPAETTVHDDDDDSAPEVMFEDAGSDYNPFGNDDDEDDDDSDSSNDEAQEDVAAKPRLTTRSSSPSGNSASASADDKHPKPEPAAAQSSAPRNYFSTNKDQDSEPAAPANPFADKTFLSAISRAADLAKSKDAAAEDEHPDETEEARQARLETEARLKKKREMMMASSARDLEDMDLGFGGGRFDDDDDDEGDERIKLSEWKGNGADEDDEEEDGGKHGKGGGGGGKKKRPGKKRKGDKNDARDVLEVMRRRQNA